MSKIKGVNVSSQIVPYDTSDTYATHEDIYGKGGFKVVQTIAERDDISFSRKKEGMLVYVVNDSTNIHAYQWLSNNWVKSKIGKDLLQFLNSEGWTYEAIIEEETGNVKVYNLIPPTTNPDPGTDPTFNLYKKIQINSFYLVPKKYDEHSFLPISHNFIELSNITNEDINLGDITLFYLPDTEDNTKWKKIILNGIIKAGSTYIIRGKQCSSLRYADKLISDYNIEWNDLYLGSSNSISIYLAWSGDGNNVYKIDKEIVDIKQITIGDVYNDENTFAPGFVDILSLNSDKFSIGDPVIVNTDIDNFTNLLFRRKFDLDPALDVYEKVISNVDSWRWIDIKKNIEPDFYIGRDKHIEDTRLKFDDTKPNTINLTLGYCGSYDDITRSLSREIGASRFITWTSVGKEQDECVYFRKITTTPTEYTQALSFSNKYSKEDYPNAPEYISTSDWSDHIKSIITRYNRVTWETYDGQIITTHRVLLGKLTPGNYEYYITRLDDPTYESDIKTFTIKNVDDASITTNYLQLGNINISCYEDYLKWLTINKKLKKDIDDSKLVDIDFKIVTGNVVKNGNRPEEWLAYFKGKECLDSIPEIYVPGPNDLGSIEGTWERPKKVEDNNIKNEYYNDEIPWLFYSYEINPIISSEILEKSSNIKCFIPWIYTVWYRADYYICMNSNITSSFKEQGDVEKNYVKIKGYKDILKDYPIIREYINLSVSEVYEGLERWFYSAILLSKVPYKDNYREIIDSFKAKQLDPSKEIKDIRYDFYENLLMMYQFGDFNNNAFIITSTSPINFINKRLFDNLGDSITTRCSNINTKDNGTYSKLKVDDMSNLNLHYEYQWSRIFMLSYVKGVISNSNMFSAISFPLTDYNSSKLVSTSRTDVVSKYEYTKIYNYTLLNSGNDTLRPLIQFHLNDDLSKDRLKSLYTKLVKPIIRNETNNIVTLSDTVKLKPKSILYPEDLNLADACIEITDYSESDIIRMEEFINAPIYINAGYLCNINNSLLERYKDIYFDKIIDKNTYPSMILYSNNIMPTQDSLIKNTTNINIIFFRNMPDNFNINNLLTSNKTSLDDIIMDYINSSNIEISGKDIIDLTKTINYFTKIWQ